MRLTSLHNIKSAMLAEIRSDMRLARTWVLIAMSMVFVTVVTIQQTTMHTFTSGSSANNSLFAQEIYTASIGGTIALIFTIGMVFLLFDIRGRDVRNRMSEVLDTRPVSNFELICGRTLGVAAIAWVTFAIGIFLSVGCLIGLATLTEHYGMIPELDGIVIFVVLGGVPGLIFYASMFTFLTSLVRNRLAAVVACLGVVSFLVWVTSKLPIVWYNAVATTMPNLDWSSPFTADLPSLRTLAQRAGLLALSGALLVMAAVLYPRRDSFRPATLTVAIFSLLMLATAGILGSSYLDHRDLAHSGRLAELHLSKRLEPRADLQSIAGTVLIRPGRELSLDLRLDYLLPKRLPANKLVFSFNSGMNITRLKVDGYPAEYTHADGLLSLKFGSAWQPGTKQTLEIAAAGRPDSQLSYLDSTLNPLRQSTTDSMLPLLGTKASYFERGFVALMPGTRWYPYPGPSVEHRRDPDMPIDYFAIDLDVAVPRGWTPAGPGRTEEGSDNDGRHFRFNPSAPVPEIGIIAAPYHRAWVKVEDLTLEILLHKSHLANLEYFAGVAQQLEDELGELIIRHHFQGLGYPYGTFSLAEVPLQLRTYGGGWSMDSVQSMPGLVMLRETSFPASRFSWLFRNLDADEDQSDERLAEIKLEHLRRFFEDDVNGGNLFSALVRNQFLFSTSASGPGSIPLNFFLERLLLKTTAQADAFFNVYLFENPRTFNELNSLAMAHTFRQSFRKEVDEHVSYVPRIRQAFTNRPSVWNLALDTALSELDYSGDSARAINVLTLKVGALATAFYDFYGERRVAKLLSELRSRFQGSTFSVEEFNSVADELGLRLEPILGTWLEEPGLPGFEVSAGNSQRLEDLADGSPQYESSFYLRNSQPNPGVVKITSEIRGAGKGNVTSTDIGGPLLVPGETSYKIHAYSEEAVDSIQVAPYLSLNRGNLTVPIPQPDEHAISSTQPRPQVEESDWISERPGTIVVDDLNLGFALVQDPPDKPPSRFTTWVRENFGNQVSLDRQGVPEDDTPRGVQNIQIQMFSDSWKRGEAPSSFGRYRTTYVSSPQDGSGGTGIFTALLPRDAKWYLEYHMPSAADLEGWGFDDRDANKRTSNYFSLGTYELVIGNDGTETIVEFAASDAFKGWNAIQQFDLKAGTVTVKVASKSGEKVILDAIRWTLPEDEIAGER